MKIIKSLSILAISTITLMSCGGGTSNQPATSQGFGKIEKEIKAKFGDDAYYTDLSIMGDATIGNMITATVTEDPESLKMGEWTQSQNAWTQTSEITLEVSEGSKASDFMFQLNEKISLSKLGGLVEEAKKQLTAEKNIENPALSMAYVYFPDDGDFSEASYNVQLKPENGGTTFRFSYKLDGELIKMDY